MPWEQYRICVIGDKIDEKVVKLFVKELRLKDKDIRQLSRLERQREAAESKLGIAVRRTKRTLPASPGVTTWFLSRSRAG